MAVEPGSGITSDPNQVQRHRFGNTLLAGKISDLASSESDPTGIDDLGFGQHFSAYMISQINQMGS
jgi:hypothetical protein